MTLRVGWFSTGRGEGSRRLLTAAVDAIRRDLPIVMLSAAKHLAPRSPAPCITAEAHHRLSA
jgi:hypothetical protein